MSAWGQDDVDSVSGRAQASRKQVRVPYPPVLDGGRRVVGVEERQGMLRQASPVGWWESFRRNVVRVWLDIGAVDLVPATAGNASVRPGEVLAEVDTAYVVGGANVFGRLSTLRENVASARSLRSDLDFRGWLWRRATVHDPQRSWVETGVVVADPNLTEEDVDWLAAAFGQGAFLRWDARGLTCVTTGVEGRSHPREPVPVQAHPGQLGCPMRFGATTGTCTPEGGPFGSATMSAGLVWEHHQAMLVDALGCSVCGGGPVAEGGPMGLREVFVPTRDGGWQWGPPKPDLDDEDEDEYEDDDDE